MHRILLLSSGKFLINHQKVFDKPFKDLKMAYIITASKGVKNTEYLERECKFFKEQGYNYEELDIDGKNKKELAEFLGKFEIVYVTGGNSFYLLKSIRDSDFEEVLREFLFRGLIYMGASAGAYVACPTIEMAAWSHQDKYDHYHVEDLNAMGLVPFLVSAHYKPEYRELLRQMVPQASLPVRVLSDEQAILFEEGKIKLLGETPEIKI